MPNTFTPSISHQQGFVTHSNVLGTNPFALSKRAMWIGCWGRATLAGSLGPGKMETGMVGQSVVRRESRARVGEAV